MKLSTLHKGYVVLWSSVLIIQLATLTRIAWSAGLWIDELYTLNAISLPWLDMILERCRRGHPVLYFTLAKAVWLLTEGTLFSPEFRLRLISLVSWGTSVGIFLVFAKRFLAPPSAFLAATVFLSSHIASLQAANARMYALALLVAMFHLWSACELARKNRVPANFGTIYLLSAVLGASVTPSFLLLQLGSTIGLASVANDGRRRALWGLATLGISLLYYLPCIYFYLLTPHQLGPVSKHVSRIVYAIPALLTGYGRGKLPENPVQLGGLFASGVIALFLAFNLCKNMRALEPAFRVLLVTFLTPFVLILGGTLLSLLPPLSFLRIGTDRYLAVFVPAGALLAGIAVEKRSFRRGTYAVGAFLLTLRLISTPSPNELKEGRLFRDEIRTLCERAELMNAPLIVCPPEIVSGLTLYCPALTPIATFGINSLDLTTVERSVEKAVSMGKLLVIYYRAHVPQVLTTCKEHFSTVTIVSKRISGSSKDPIFAILLFERPLPTSRTQGEND